MSARYWLRVNGLAWEEATKDQFIKSERGAGFYPKYGNGLATAGFSGGSVQGRITYGEITAEDYPDEPDFVEQRHRLGEVLVGLPGEPDDIARS